MADLCLSRPTIKEAIERGVLPERVLGKTVPIMDQRVEKDAEQRVPAEVVVELARRGRLRCCPRCLDPRYQG